MSDEVTLNRDTPLVEVLDRIIDKGVVLQGDVTLSVADVDLIYLGLKVVLCSVDRLRQPPAPQQSAMPPAPPERGALVPISLGAGVAPQASVPPTPLPLAPVPPPSALKPLTAENLPLEDSTRGLAQLVLTLVELLRDLMERQAVRRMEHGTVTDAEIDRMSTAFEQIAARMDELKVLFGLTDADLNLDLGPLGKLLD